MTEEQRLRIEQLQQRRRPPAASPEAEPVTAASRRAPSRLVPARHAARRGRMLALSGSVAGATFLVSTMWTHAAAPAAAAPVAVPDPVTAPAAPSPQDGILHIRFVRVPSSDGAAALRQATPQTTVTTPPPVTPAPSPSPPAPEPVTRSRGS